MLGARTRRTASSIPSPTPSVPDSPARYPGPLVRQVLVTIVLLVATVTTRDRVHREQEMMAADEALYLKMHHADEFGVESDDAYTRSPKAPLRASKGATLLLSNLPSSVTRSVTNPLALREALGQFGSVVSVVVVPKQCRQLVLRMETRERLLEASASAKAAYYVAASKLFGPAESGITSSATFHRVVHRIASSSSAHSNAKSLTSPEGISGGEDSVSEPSTGCMAMDEGSQSGPSACGGSPYQSTHASTAPSTKNGSSARIGTLREAMHEAAEALKRHTAESEAIAEGSSEGCSVAFVTFSSEAEATRCLECIRQRASFGQHAVSMFHTFCRRTRGGGRSELLAADSNVGTQLQLPPPTGIQVSEGATGGRARQTSALNGVAAQRAPDPSDVIWSNIAIGLSERVWRQCLSIFITLCTATLGTAGIAAISYLSGERIVNHAFDTNSVNGVLGIIVNLLLALALAIPCILCNVLIFATVPQLSDRLERQRTFAGKESSIAIKLAVFQVYNTVVASSAFLFDHRISQFSRAWYPTGGVLIGAIVFGDAVFIQVLLDWVHVDVLFRRFLLAPRATTQLQMDRIYIAAADIYLAFRYQFAIKFIVIILMFATAIPVLLLVGALYFYVAAWIDRDNLLRRLSPPPCSSAVLSNIVTVVIFPTAVVLHVILGIIFFADADDRNHGNQTDYPSDGFRPSAGSSAPGSVSPIQRDKRYTEYVQWGTFGLMVLGITFFGVRELFRWYGIETRLNSTHKRVLTKVATRKS